MRRSIIESNKVSQTVVVRHGNYLDNSSCMQFRIKSHIIEKKHYCAPTIVVTIVITIVEADESTVTGIGIDSHGFLM